MGFVDSAGGNMTDDQKLFSYFQLFLGLFLGSVLGAFCSFVLYFLFISLLPSRRLAFLAPLANVVTLLLLGWIFYKSGDKGFVRGMLISLGLVLILSTTCGVNLLMR